jgi:VanZ family protein
VKGEKMKNWIQKNSIWLSLLLVLAVMLMIYGFSAQTGEESGEMSGRLTTWVLKLVVPGYEEMAAETQENIRSTVGLLVRKMAHFSEYALLGFSLMLHIAQIRKKTTVRLPILWAWGVGTLYAASDEFHQGFVAGRGPSVVDVTIDSCGVIAGVLVMFWICRHIAKSRGKCYN